MSHTISPRKRQRMLLDEDELLVTIDVRNSDYAPAEIVARLDNVAMAHVLFPEVVRQNPTRLVIASHKARILLRSDETKRSFAMPNVFVEARPKGRPEGSPINDYVVEDHADHVLHTAATQAAAIDWAKKAGHKPLVARVRHLNDKKRPDHWREA